MKGSDNITGGFILDDQDVREFFDSDDDDEYYDDDSSFSSETERKRNKKKVKKSKKTEINSSPSSISSKQKKNENKTSSTNKNSSKSQKRKRTPKPPDMPRRPLSAYNIYFQEQRALIIGCQKKTTNSSSSDLNGGGDGPEPPSPSSSFVRKKRIHRKTHGKISFSDLAKQIGKKWNSLTPTDKKRFEEAAAKEKVRYKEELDIYHRNKNQQQKKKPENKGERKDVVAKRKMNDSQAVQRKNRDHHSNNTQASYTPEYTSTTYRRSSRCYSTTPLHLDFDLNPIPVTNNTTHNHDWCNNMEDENNDLGEIVIHPLPISYMDDPSDRHSPSFVHEHEMYQLVSSFLEKVNDTEPIQRFSI